jgi:hypothetical protein
MEGMIIMSAAEIRKIIRAEIEEAMQENKESREVNQPNKRYLLEDAAYYLQMAVPTLRMHREKIGGTKIGKRWSFTQQELDKFIEKQRSRPVMK